MKNPINNIKVNFDDNKTICEIDIDQETKIEELIDKFYIENHIEIRNKIFLCRGENILVESKNKKIKEFNKHNEDNKVAITVNENVIDIS